MRETVYRISAYGTNLYKVEYKHVYTYEKSFFGFFKRKVVKHSDFYKESERYYRSVEDAKDRIDAVLYAQKLRDESTAQMHERIKSFEPIIYP